MRLSVGADERHTVVNHVLRLLKKAGHKITWYGPTGKSSVPWPEVARCVAEDVASQRCDEGILFCWTGTGVSMAANKIAGVRAALCSDAETARGARLWNDANVLCLSIRLTSETVAAEILQAWFSTRYQPNPNDDACLEELRTLDARQPGTKN